MKRLFCILITALLLCGCSKTETLDYYNTEEGCFLGSTHYHNFAGMDIQLWNPAWDAPLEGLCRDLDGALGSCAVDAVRGRGCEECEWWDGAKDVCSLAERAVEMGVSAWARAKS